MELSPQNVAAALRELSVEQTTELVVHLGVQIKVPDGIALQNSGVNHKIHSIQAWLDSDTHASWEKLVSGLKQIGMSTVAESVESTFAAMVEAPATVCTSASVTVPPVQAVTSPAPLEATHVTQVPASEIPTSVQSFTPSLNPSQPSTVTTDRTVEVKAKIEQFKEEFANIKADVISSLHGKGNQDPKFFSTFRNHLLELPVSERATHAQMLLFCENEKEILEARDIQDLCTIICCYCNFSNYEIIFHLIRNFCEGALKSRMFCYYESLITFEKATTIDLYSRAIPALDSEVPETFAKVVVEIDRSSSVYTLHKVRQFTEALAKIAYLHPYTIYIESVSKSSVLVVLRIPPSSVRLVRTTITLNFAKEHHLKRVVLDGLHVPLAFSVSEREDLVC